MRMSYFANNSGALIVLLAAWACSPNASAWGQNFPGFENGVEGGVGTLTVGPTSVQLNGVSALPRCAQYLSSSGTWVIAAQNPGSTGLVPHHLLIIDDAGYQLGLLPQDHSQISIFGHEDFATDDLSPAQGIPAAHLFACDRGSIRAYGLASGSPVPVFGSTQVQTANGLRTASFPITPVGVTPQRFLTGLAFNPRGNGGNGSFWVAASGPNQLFEITLTGGVLRSPPIFGAITGMARDPETDELWIRGGLSPFGGPFIRPFSPQTSTPTGPGFPLAVPGLGNWGGLNLAEYRLGSTFLPSAGPPRFELTAVESDGRFAAYRLQLAPGFAWRDETQLVSSLNFGPASTTRKTLTPGTVLSFGFNEPPFSSPWPVILLLNLDGDTTFPASTLGLPEFYAANDLSYPRSLGLSRLIGDGIGVGNAFAPRLITQPDRITDPDGILLVIPGWPSGLTIRMQAIYVTPNLPWLLAATNTLWFDVP